MHARTSRIHICCLSHAHWLQTVIIILPAVPRLGGPSRQQASRDPVGAATSTEMAGVAAMREAGWALDEQSATTHLFAM